jgi:hypothetical protein
VFEGVVPERDSNGCLFVVGSRVEDFKVLNQERINCIAVGAIQAQHTRILALEAAIDSLMLKLRPSALKAGRPA